MSGYRFICRDCGKVDGFMVGMDYSYARTYRVTRRKAETGAYGTAIQQFLEKHPEAAINPENRLFLCPSCGNWEIAPDLTLHLPENERTEAEPFVIFEEDTGKASGYVPALPREHVCRCGAVMRESVAPGEETLRCPACGGTMVIDVEMGSEQ